MTDDWEDTVDALLREQFEGPVPDDGFCDRAMKQLPARPRRNTWPLAVGSFAGVAACWLSLKSAPITYIGWHDWLSGDWSPSALVLFASMMGLAILALAWTIAEADDRYDLSPRRMIR